MRRRALGGGLLAALSLGAGQAEAAAPACPGKTFEAFLDAFLASPDVQRRFTADPLTTSHVSMGMVDPRPMAMVESERVAALTFPLAPSRRELVALGYGVQVVGGDSARPVVTIAGAGTDRRRYSFQRAGCWRLVRLDDESL